MSYPVRSGSRSGILEQDTAFVDLRDISTRVRTILPFLHGFLDEVAQPRVGRNDQMRYPTDWRARRGPEKPHSKAVALGSKRTAR